MFRGIGHGGAAIRSGIRVLAGLFRAAPQVLGQLARLHRGLGPRAHSAPRRSGRDSPHVRRVLLPAHPGLALHKPAGL